MTRRPNPFPGSPHPPWTTCLINTSIPMPTKTRERKVDPISRTMMSRPKKPISNKHWKSTAAEVWPREFWPKFWNQFHRLRIPGRHLLQDRGHAAVIPCEARPVLCQALKEGKVHKANVPINKKLKSREEKLRTLVSDQLSTALGSKGSVCPVR